MLICKRVDPQDDIMSVMFASTFAVSKRLWKKKNAPFCRVVLRTHFVVHRCYVFRDKIMNLFIATRRVNVIRTVSTIVGLNGDKQNRCALQSRLNGVKRNLASSRTLFGRRKATRARVKLLKRSVVAFSVFCRWVNYRFGIVR